MRFRSLTKGDKLKPNEMPNKNKAVQVRLLAGLTETQASSWDRKNLSRDKEGKEVLDTVKVTHTVVRYPLAQNVSEDNVERAAKRWLL